MTRGQEWPVSRVVMLRDRLQGMPGTLYQYNFITNGGYAPTPVTGTPCNVASQGSLLFDMFGEDGQPTLIYVLGALATAKDVPLRIYVTEDGLEPYFFHNGPKNAGKYKCRTTFQFANGASKIISEWEEQWN
jgi:hypothetical protein